MSLASGPILPSRYRAIGYTPSIGTKPNVVFKPTTPQQAAGTRTEPAVSVPKATSAIPDANATAFPDEDPPGIRRRFNGFTAVPKYSFMPDGETANSVRFVLPTICTSRWRAIARHGASFSAGLWVSKKISEPAVVITPFMSMLSLTASLRPLLFGFGGQ